MSNQPNPNAFFRSEDMGTGNFPIKGGTMNQPINDGGSAFPRSATDHCHSQEGMTLRDYFAGKAIEALIVRGWGLENASGKAYEIANAMLKAREAKP